MTGEGRCDDDHGAGHLYGGWLGDGAEDHAGAVAESQVLGREALGFGHASDLADSQQEFDALLRAAVPLRIEPCLDALLPLKPSHRVLDAGHDPRVHLFGV